MSLPQLPQRLNNGPHRVKALQLAHQIRTEWEHSPHQDLRSLVHEVQSAFAEEANHELRQALFQLSAQLELALVKGRGGQASLATEQITKLLGAVGRATSAVETYLDRGEAAKMVIELTYDAFDIGTSLMDLLRWNGFLEDPANVEAHVDPFVIQGDKDHLMDILGHMASRFFLLRRAPERVLITLIDQRDHVEGFFGLAGSRLTAQDLMAEFDKVLEMDDMQIDMPYSRALIERHGGTIYVAAGPDRASGFGFTIPARQQGTQE